MSISVVTFALAVVGLAVAVLMATRVVVRELRRLRSLAIAPRLVLDIEADADTAAVVTITNVGAGPAFDADLSVELRERDDEEDRGRPPIALPHRFHTARVLRPGDQVRFLPPGDPTNGYLAPSDLVAQVRSIHLTGTATDLCGDPLEVVDHLTDPFHRLHNVLEPTRRSD
jgi:hypothetical protein